MNFFFPTRLATSQEESGKPQIIHRLSSTVKTLHKPAESPLFSLPVGFPEDKGGSQAIV
jgi:hypothetical protein